jgi:hypothetical protein
MNIMSITVKPVVIKVILPGNYNKNMAK